MFYRIFFILSCYIVERIHVEIIFIFIVCFYISLSDPFSAFLVYELFTALTVPSICTVSKVVNKWTVVHLCVSSSCGTWRPIRRWLTAAGT